MSHLYRTHQEQQAKQRRHQSLDDILLPPNAARSSSLTRRSQRDVFSDESVGDPWARRDPEEDPQHRVADSYDTYYEQQQQQQRPLIPSDSSDDDSSSDGLLTSRASAQDDNNATTTSTPYSNHPWDDEHPDETSFSDASTIVASSSSHQSSSVATPSSLSMEDSTVLTPIRSEQVIPTLYGHTQFTTDKTPPLPSDNHHDLLLASQEEADSSSSEEVYLDDSDPIHNGGKNTNQISLSEHFSACESQEDSIDRQQRTKLILAAGLGCCLLWIVIVGAIVFAVLGSQHDNHGSSNPPTAEPPTLSPSSSSSVSSLRPVTVQWAQRSLPPATLQSISWNPVAWNGATVNSTVSPQTRALHWVQEDPYFLPMATTMRDRNVTANTNVTDTHSEEPHRQAQRLTRFGLATLYYATNGDVWSQELVRVSTMLGTSRNNTNTNVTNDNINASHSGWLSHDHECDWPRLTCLDDGANDDDGNTLNDTTIHRGRGLEPSITSTGRFSRLQLTHLPVMGTLPAEIGLVTSLQVLEIYPNQPSDHGQEIGLRGSLPTQLGRLTNLVWLDLHHNRLSGSMIPTELGLLTKLEALSLHDNSLEANSTVPTEVCQLLQSSEAALEVVSVDCQQVACPCGCQCPTSANQSSVDDASHSANDNGNNIFHRDNDTAISTPSPSSSPSNPRPMLPTTAPAPTVEPSSSTLTDAFTPDVNVTDAPLLCNGLANICDWRLPEVLFPMVHNAMASQADGFVIANHILPVEDAVQAGYRGVNLDVCRCNDKLVFCHNLCLLGSRDPVDVFQKLLQFLVDHPNEVLQLSFQITNSDSLPDIDLLEFYGLMESLGTNFTDMIYVHEPADEPWPTLRTLIERNKVSSSIL